MRIKNYNIKDVDRLSVNQSFIHFLSLQVHETNKKIYN